MVDRIRIKVKVVLAEFLPLAAIATTPTAAQTLQPLVEAANATLWVPQSLNTIENAHVYSGSLKEHINKLWYNNRAFIFCMATGAVVRLIAPLLEDKASDPAVVVIDENGKFVISLCSGHQGGADQLATAIAIQLGAMPILTGASNGLGLPAIDLLGVPFGWNKGEGDWTGVSSAMVRSQEVQIIQEAGSTLWQNSVSESLNFYFGFPEDGSPISPKARIWISPIQRKFSQDADIAKVQWHPRVLWVGIGCERGTSKELIELAIKQACQNNHLAEAAIAGVATIDFKADEVGLIELCKERNWPLITFPAEVLRTISVPNPSDIVEAEVGTPSVAEAAALYAIRQTPNTVPTISNTNPLGTLKITNFLLVPKQILRVEGQPGAVTIAIAQAEKEYTGRTGQLFLVGSGPGKLEQMTPAAQTAISQADVVIGYTLYIDLISPLVRPNQIIEEFPITQERERADRAIELAQWGLKVAVVSSGDCGIYGMAGLVFEELRAKGWDGQSPQVQVFPGISALQAAASRVGAPLMHDFCAISLSDLLTPWEVIEQRLHAAAQADFVTALYNPRSQNRTKQIEIAQTIFLKYRNPNTPVAIVRSAYRENEQITLTTLDQLLEKSVDMLSTVLIGNSNTSFHKDWMITPRGYLGFGKGVDS